MPLQTLKKMEVTTKLVKLQANLYHEKLDLTNKHEVVFCCLLVSRNQSVNEEEVSRR